MRLAVKFFLAFSLVILVLAGIAAWSLREVGKLATADRSIPVVTDAEALRAAASLRESVLVAKRVDMRSLVFSDAEYAAASRAAAERISTELESLRTLVTTDEQKKLLSKASDAFDSYHRAVTKARELRNTGDVKGAEQVLRKDAEPVVDRVVEDLDRLAALTRDGLDRAQAEAAAAVERARAEIEGLHERTWKAVITAMILAVLAALGGSAIIAVRMTRSLRRLSNATRAVAEGAFHDPLPVDRRDEIGHLAKSFNTMAARLREMDEMKEKFYSTVSHELRSPLNAMQEAARLIEAKGAGPLTPKQERLIAIFKKGTGRLLRLVNEVLDLSRMNAGMLPIERGLFPVEKAVTQAIDELKPQAEQQRIALKSEIDPAAGDMFGDYDRIVEVLLNLIGNALRFTSPGGSVSVGVCAMGDDQIRIQVRDTGIGIPPALVPVIFERFRQAHSGKGGTGLGLAIVKSLVEAHDGQVSVESQEGKGSTFTVMLPRGTAGAGNEEARVEHA
jgi:signal transduction histidine kinase